MNRLTSNSGEFGDRTPRQERWRVRILLIMAVLLAGLELSRPGFLGAPPDPATGTNYFRGRSDPPPKRDGVQRIIYISNSHARTGGEAARHLQDLLERSAPGAFEVVDMADPGIFAPDMLQRVAAARGLDPDEIVLGLSYISFGDRMRLTRQAHSSRSFFNDGVFSGLSAGFWLRHYDLGLYSDQLAIRLSTLIREREAIRGLWVDALPTLARGLGLDDRSNALVLDLNQRWRFPEGYDKNLFQWRLYAGDRDDHLADLDDLLALASSNGIPLLGIDLGTDTGKSEHPASTEDFRAYHAAVRERFPTHSRSMMLRDQGADFPTRFSTFDALHPHRLGARLHALDTALTLSDQGALKDFPPPEGLLAAYRAASREGDALYTSSLDARFSPTRPSGFRRFDLFDPPHARGLLHRLTLTTPGSAAERILLIRLARRIAFWGGYTDADERARLAQRPMLLEAYGIAVDSARRRIALFRDRLTLLQGQRLAGLPLPDLSSATLRATREAGRAGSIALFLDEYTQPGGDAIGVIRDNAGRILAYQIRPAGGGIAYQRIDLLGDGSFVLVQGLSMPLIAPSWFSGVPERGLWGI
ncbi:MAG: hypothetical protein ACPGU7_10345 [Gammaproteobacteria bacterium]